MTARLNITCPLCDHPLHTDTFTNEQMMHTWWTCVGCGTQFKHPQWQIVGGTLWPVGPSPQEGELMTLEQAQRLLEGIGQCRVYGHALAETYATLHRQHGGVAAASPGSTPRTIHIYRCTRCDQRYIQEGFQAPEFPGVNV